MKKLSVPLILLLAVAGCNIFSSDKGGSVPFVNYQEGQTSLYESRSYFRLADSTEYEKLYTELTETVVTKADDQLEIGDTLLTDLIKMEMTLEQEGSGTFHGSVWYHYDELFFTEYVYSRPPLGSLAQPKIAELSKKIPRTNISHLLEKFSPARMITGDFHLEDAGDEELSLRSDPRRVHPVRFHIGRKWTSFTDPFLSKSEITGQKVIEINDSQYDTYVIETANYLNGSEFNMTSYFDSNGLVKRVVVQEQDIRDEVGEVIDEGFFRGVIERVSFSE